MNSRKINTYLLQVISNVVLQEDGLRGEDEIYQRFEEEISNMLYSHEKMEEFRSKQVLGLCLRAPSPAFEGCWSNYPILA